MFWHISNIYIVVLWHRRWIGRWL